MPSENKTSNIGLNQWQGNEYPKRQDFLDDNEIIDREIGSLKKQSVAVGNDYPSEPHANQIFYKII